MRISSPLKKEYVPGVDYIVIKLSYAAIRLGRIHSKISYTPHFQVTVCHYTVDIFKFLFSRLVVVMGRDLESLKHSYCKPAIS